MSLQNIGKGALRVAKNYAKGYSIVEARVREATSNDPWGPSVTQMEKIAQMTYNRNDFVEIMGMLDKRLNDNGKNWRHVFKCFTVIDYLLHVGSEDVVVYFRDNIYIIKTLKEFQYVDEYGKDQGANVRQKARDITNLLKDEARLRQQRLSQADKRKRIMGQAENDDDDESQAPRGDENNARRTRGGKQTLAAEQARGAEDPEVTVRAFGLRNELFPLGDSDIGSSSSSLDTIVPINHENPQLLPYPSSISLPSNGSIYGASFMTSPTYDSLEEVLPVNDIAERAQRIHDEDAFADDTTSIIHDDDPPAR